MFECGGLCDAIEWIGNACTVFHTFNKQLRLDVDRCCWGLRLILVFGKGEGQVGESPVRRVQSSITRSTGPSPCAHESQHIYWQKSPAHHQSDYLILGKIFDLLCRTNRMARAKQQPQREARHSCTRSSWCIELSSSTVARGLQFFIALIYLHWLVNACCIAGYNSPAWQKLDTVNRREMAQQLKRVTPDIYRHLDLIVGTPEFAQVMIGAHWGGREIMRSWRNSEDNINRY